MNIKNSARVSEAEPKFYDSWVRLKKYCELTGDTSNAVHARRKKRVWVDGKHCKIGPDSKLWINVKEVNHWICASPAPVKTTIDHKI